MIRIEKNVPMPLGPGRKKYPFDDLQIGDSFVIDAKRRPAASLYKAQKKLSRKFSCYRVAKGKYRIWRTA